MSDCVGDTEGASVATSAGSMADVPECCGASWPISMLTACVPLPSGCIACTARLLPKASALRRCWLSLGPGDCKRSAGALGGADVDAEAAAAAMPSAPPLKLSLPPLALLTVRKLTGLKAALPCGDGDSLRWLPLEAEAKSSSSEPAGCGARDTDGVAGTASSMAAW